MNSAQENEKIGSLFICLNRKNNQLLDSTFTTTTLRYSPGKYQAILEQYREDAIKHFNTFEKNVLNRYAHGAEAWEIELRFYLLENVYMQQIPLQSSNENYTVYIESLLSYIQKQNIFPETEKLFLSAGNDIHIGNRILDIQNVEELLREYSEIPHITKSILEWLKKNPLRKIDNKDGILDALKCTKYYQENQLSDTVDLNQIDYITSYHILLANLKFNSNKSHELYDLMAFQRSLQKLERINLIWAYRRCWDITKKQIELCTLGVRNISYPDDLYQAFQHTDYYREFINENIAEEGVNPFHLLLAARKIQYANSFGDNLSGGSCTPRLYWPLKEDGLKDRMAIEIQLLKQLPPNKTPLIERRLEILLQDVTLGRKRHFYGIESILEDVRLLQEKFEKNIPIRAEFLKPQHIKIETENLTAIPFERFKIQEIFQATPKNDDIGPIYLASGFTSQATPADISMAISSMTTHCPILKPVFHCKLKFDSPDYLPKAEIKKFVEDFIEQLGYPGNPYVVSYSRDHEMNIFTPNIIYYNESYHPICTINNYSNASKALNLLELKYNLLKSTPTNQLDQYIKKNLDPNNPNTPGKNKGKKNTI